MIIINYINTIINTIIIIIIIIIITTIFYIKKILSKKIPAYGFRVWLAYVWQASRRTSPRMTSAYDFAYDSAYGMFIKKKSRNFTYDLRVWLRVWPPRMPSIFNNLLLLWITDTCAMPTPPKPEEEKASQALRNLIRFPNRPDANSSSSSSSL